MAAALFRLIAAVFVVAVIAAGVSAETHHLANLEPDLDVATWLSGRVFRVGDKLRFQNIGRDEIIVEVGGMEELENCDVTNPIRMYTDDVSLEEAGIRYFTSGNPEACRNGLKLPLAVNSPDEPPSPFRPFYPPSWPPYGPSYGPPPIKPPEPVLPPVEPPPLEPPEPELVSPPPPPEPHIRIPPPPPFEPIEPPVKPPPYEPIEPPVEPPPPPYEPIEPPVEPPPPPYEPIEPPVKPPPPPPPPPVEPPVHPPPPPPPPPSAAAPFMNGVSFVILVCGLHMITQFAS